MLTVYCCYIFISMQISFLHVHLLIFRDEGAALPLLWQTQTLPMRCITATSSKPLKYLSSRAAIWSRIFILRLQAPSGAGCVCLCFCSSPASCSSAVSTRPPSSRQTCGTQPRCHSAAQAPQWLRFPLGLTEVFAVFHIVGIQHQPVYWSPCGSSLSLPSSSFLCACFSPFPQHTFFIWCVYPPFTQSTHTAHLWGGILAYIRRSTRYLMWRKSHWSVWGWLVVFILYYKNNHVFKWINNFISLE